MAKTNRRKCKICNKAQRVTLLYLGKNYLNCLLKSIKCFKSSEQHQNKEPVYEESISILQTGEHSVWLPTETHNAHCQEAE